MALVTAQVVLKSASGVTADNTTNTWHFDSPITTASFDNITAALKDFYDDVYVGRNSVLMASSGHEINFYVTADPSPKPPVAMTSFALATGVSTTSLPPECAIVCSFQASRLAGAVQARRRNRIYLGPFGTAALSVEGTVASATRTAISSAALALMDASNLATDWIWQVYSPTNAEAYDIDNGWVDNAWDTQRRRGVESTVRSTWVNPA